MSKPLLTTFLLFAVVVNLFAVIPPHAGGEGGCSEECCAIARQGSLESSPEVLCCIVNCEQNAETTTTPAIAVGVQQNQNLPSFSFVSTVKSISYIQQTQFPSSPTRHITGSSARYLDNSAFLI